MCSAIRLSRSSNARPVCSTCTLRHQHRSSTADAQHRLDLAFERLELAVDVRLALGRAPSPAPCFQPDQGNGDAEEEALGKSVGSRFDGSAQLEFRASASRRTWSRSAGGRERRSRRGAEQVSGLQRAVGRTEVLRRSSERCMDWARRMHARRNDGCSLACSLRRALMGFDTQRRQPWRARTLARVRMNSEPILALAIVAPTRPCREQAIGRARPELRAQPQARRAQHSTASNVRLET